VLVSGYVRDNSITVVAVVVPCLAVVIIVVVIAVLVYCYKVNKNRYKNRLMTSKKAQLSQNNRQSLRQCILSVYFISTTNIEYIKVTLQ